MRVLITGGAGFIGPNLACPHHSYEVPDGELSTGHADNADALDVRFHETDNVQGSRLVGCPQGQDSGAHLSALSSETPEWLRSVGATTPNVAEKTNR